MHIIEHMREVKAKQRAAAGKDLSNVRVIHVTVVIFSVAKCVYNGTSSH